MRLHSRRTLLRAVGAAATAGLAGCADDDTGGGTPTERTPTDGPTERTSATPTAGRPTESSPTAAPERLRLTAVDEPASAEAPVTVYPPALRRWLRRAADGETVRGHAGTPVYVPEPVLPAFEHVRLAPEGPTYEVHAEGGTRYRVLVGAERVDPPEDATVTPVADLAPERRELARMAIAGDDDARVYQETRLGEWVREEFFGGYYAHEGRTYRGTERQQTDAEFFSTELWLVLQLERTAAQVDPVDLRLPEIPDAVRTAVDRALRERERDETEATTAPRELPSSVLTFARETELLLTHTGVFEVDVVRG